MTAGRGPGPGEAAGPAAEAIELALLQAESLAGFLTAATAGFVRIMGLSCARLILEDPAHELRRLFAEEAPAAMEGVVCTDSLIALAPALGRLSRPWTGRYVAADHGLLFGAAQPRGVAILPLVRHGRLLALACLGTDADGVPGGFGPAALARLSAVLALALENGCNAARLARAGAGDVLTGWHGRRYLSSRLREEIARSARLDRSLACLAVGVGDLGSVNARHGTSGGDELIKELALRLETLIRASDTVARISGGEFVVLLPDTDADGAALVAARVRAALEAPCELPGAGAVAVPVSVGVAAIRPPRAERDLKGLAERLLAQADAARDRGHG